MSDASTPILSISVACYKVQDYLQRALDSYTDERLSGRVEVILVDDGSTDDTARMMDEAVSAHPDIFCAIHKENGGHGSTVNAAIAQARGRYFRVIDGDDWVDTDELVRFVQELEALDCDMVVDEHSEVDMTGAVTRRVPLPADVPTGEVLPFEVAFAADSRAVLLGMHSLTLRTELLRAHDIRLLEHCFYVDMEFVIKSMLAASTVCFLRRDVYRYLMGNAAQSVADDNFVAHYEDHLRVCEEIFSLLDKAASTDLVHRRVLELRCRYLAETHYNVCLIFDKDRKRGKERAKAFHDMLHARYPRIADASEKRYRLASILHTLGVDSQEKLDKLTGRDKRA